MSRLTFLGRGEVVMYNKVVPYVATVGQVVKNMARQQNDNFLPNFRKYRFLST